jgi:hypothetical protein
MIILFARMFYYFRDRKYIKRTQINNAKWTSFNRMIVTIVTFITICNVIRTIFRDIVMPIYLSQLYTHIFNQSAVLLAFI